MCAQFQIARLLVIVYSICLFTVFVVVVYRLEVVPAYVEQSSVTNVARINEQKIEKKLQFPLMTYWPVDL